MTNEGIQIHGKLSKDETTGNPILDRKIGTFLAKARRVGGKLQRMTEEIAKRHNAVVSPLNLKTRKSVVNKIRRGDSIEDIKDLARNTIVVNDEKDIAPIIDELKKQNGFMRHKSQGADEKERKDIYYGYSGNIVNVVIDGMPTEIQVNTAEMIYAKEPPVVAARILGVQRYREIKKRMDGLMAGEGHAFYEQLRMPKGNGLGKSRKNRIGVKLDSIRYYDMARSKVK